MRTFDNRPGIFYQTVIVRVLQQDAKDRRVEFQRISFRNPQRKAEGLGAAAQHLERLRKASRRHDERIPIFFPVFRTREPLLDAMQHRHGFGRRGGLVEQRCVGNLGARQIAHHRLEVEQRFQAPLRDLGLVGCVRRIPAGVFQHVAEDDAWRDRPVVARPDVRPVAAVLGGNAAQALEKVVFAFALGQVQRPIQADACRDRFVNQRVERRGANGFEHGLAVAIVGADVAVLEVVGRVERHRLNAEFAGAAAAR